MRFCVLAIPARMPRSDDFKLFGHGLGCVVQNLLKILARKCRSYDRLDIQTGLLKQLLADTIIGDNLSLGVD